MKKIMWIVVLILVAAGIFWILQKGGTPPTPSSNTGTGLNSSPGPSSTPKGVYKAITQPNSVTYTQLFNQYIGRSIQFNDLCQGQPGQMVIKRGTQILLDNRSSIPKTILLDKQSVSLAAYGYKVVTITTDKSLPYSLGIDCRSANGSGENTTTLNIQASILQLIK